MFNFNSNKPLVRVIFFLIVTLCLGLTAGGFFIMKDVSPEDIETAIYGILLISVFVVWVLYAIIFFRTTVFQDRHENELNKKMNSYSHFD